MVLVSVPSRLCVKFLTDPFGIARAYHALYPLTKVHSGSFRQIRTYPTASRCVRVGQTPAGFDHVGLAANGHSHDHQRYSNGSYLRDPAPSRTCVKFLTGPFGIARAYHALYPLTKVHTGSIRQIRTYSPNFFFWTRPCRSFSNCIAAEPYQG